MTMSFLNIEIKKTNIYFIFDVIFIEKYKIFHNPIIIPKIDWCPNDWLIENLKDRNFKYKIFISEIYI